MPRCTNYGGAGYSPPCITARRGGCVIKKISRSTEADAAGVVFHLFSFGKPPRPRYQRMLRGILLIARPPLLAMMQGGEYLDSNSFTPSAEVVWHERRSLR